MKGVVWLASYPRSGNTWARLALWTLYHRRPVTLGTLGRFGRMAVNRQQIDVMLDSDSGLLKRDELQRLRVHMHRAIAAKDETPLVKVHDAWLRTPEGYPVHDPAVTRGTIYLIRDPRDVAISWARFTGRTIDEAIAYLADPDAMIGLAETRIDTQIPQWVGSWSSNVTSWIDESGLDPLVVRYEDMVGDPRTAFRTIAAYLGWEADEALLTMAVDATRFDRLTALEADEGFRERPRMAEAFFRSGQAQGWRQILDPAQAARIARDHAEVMARFNYY